MTNPSEDLEQALADLLDAGLGAGKKLHAQLRIRRLIARSRTDQRIDLWRVILEAIQSCGAYHADELLQNVYLPNEDVFPDSEHELVTTLFTICQTRGYHLWTRVLGDILVRYFKSYDPVAIQTLLHGWSFDEKAGTRATAVTLLGRLFPHLPDQAQAKADIERIARDPTEDPYLGRKETAEAALVALTWLSESENKQVAGTTLEDTSHVAGTRAWSSYDPIWGHVDMTHDPRLCFMLMPLAANPKWPNVQEAYARCIKPTAGRLGLDCMRADDIFGVHAVMGDIWRYICKARVVIADVTGRNPNVFYELGICHTVGRQAVMITQSDEDVPFDIKALRYIKYEYTPEGAEKLSAVLESTLRRILHLERPDTSESLARGGV